MLSERPQPRPTARSRPTPRSPQPGDRPTRSARRQAQKSAGGRRTALAVVTLCVLVALIVTAVLITLGHRNPHATPQPSPTTSAAASGARLDDPDRATAFLAGAVSDIPAVTTYDYRTLDDALQAGLSVTTGSYRTAYRAALTGELASVARARHVTHEFMTSKLGIGQMTADGSRAKILIFGQQQVTDDNTGGKPVVTPVTLCATIQHSGNRYLISDLVPDGNAGLPPGSPDLGSAVRAAATEIQAMFSYRRASFATDLQRASAGATGTLRSELQQRAAATKAAMAKGGYDLRATVTGYAVEQASGRSVTVLVAGQREHLGASGSGQSRARLRYEVSMTRSSSGSWLASQATAVDGS